MADLNQPQNSNLAEYRPAAVAPMQGNNGLNGPYGESVVQPYVSGQGDMYHNNPAKFGHPSSFIRPLPVENPLNNPNLIGYNMPPYQGTAPTRPVGKTVEDIQPHPGGNVAPPYGYPSTSQGTVPLRPVLPPGADVTYSSSVNHFQTYSSSGMSSTHQSLPHMTGPSMQHLPAGGTGIANGPGSQNYQINSAEMIPNGPTKFMKQQQPPPPSVRMPQTVPQGYTPNVGPPRHPQSVMPPRHFPPKAVITGSSPTPTSDSTSPSLGPAVSYSNLQNMPPQGRPQAQTAFNSVAKIPPTLTTSTSLGVQTQSSAPVNAPPSQNYPPLIPNNMPPSSLPACSIPSGENSAQGSQYSSRSIVPPTVSAQSNTSVTRSGLVGSRRTYPQPNTYTQASISSGMPPPPSNMNYPNTVANSTGQKMQNQIPPISTAVGPVCSQPSYNYSGPQIPPVSTAVGSINSQVSNYGYSGSQIPPVSTAESLSTNQPSNYGFGGNQLTQQMSSLNLQGSGPIDLLHYRNVLPPIPVEPPRIVLPFQEYKNVNCSTELFRCTLTKIPETQTLLQKSRLPLGILIHPFKDLNHLPVIQCTTIVRCRSCRTYINPFVYFVDHKRWKCNLCFRVNELPEEFQYDPVSKSYGDPSRRPEIKSATIEFIAPSEYMLRPPQPAVYLFLLDVSHLATETGYLRIFCEVLLESLDKLPGDGRTRVGFITYDSAIHFYNLAEGLSQPQMMVVSDIDDIFLPCPDNLLVNLQESKELITDTLTHLPMKFVDNKETDSALGAALQAAFKLMAPTGGRVTVMQVSIPNLGPGALKSREDPNQRAAKDVQNLGPANDFYKKLSLDCSGQQISVDLFVLASQYVDISTLSCISKYSGGCIHYYPGMHSLLNASQTERFENDLRRYLTRKIGFEAVMRIRCTKGLSIHTFHGNFFVRSTDLLSLPNINPDAGFGMQVSIEEQLNETQSACFQAALLYTSSKGERRIRVHTLCLPVSNNLLDIMGGADQQTVIGLLAKMAVDRSLTTSMSDARDALINACIDALGVYRSTQSVGHGALLAPSSLRLLPLYVLGLLKHVAFRVGTSTRLDERVFAMNQMKTLPLNYLMLSIYPSLYAVHALDDRNAIVQDDKTIPQPPLLQLSAEKVDSHGAYLMDTGDAMYLYICRAIHDHFCQAVLNASNYSSINDRMTELPELDTPESENLRNFISHLQTQRPFSCVFLIIRDDSKSRHLFLQHLVDDRSESTFSYFEFLQHLKQQISK